MFLLALYPVFAAREVDPDVVLRVKTLGRGCLASGLQLGFSRLEMDLCCYIPFQPIKEAITLGNSLLSLELKAQRFCVCMCSRMCYYLIICHRLLKDLVSAQFLE